MSSNQDDTFGDGDEIRQTPLPSVLAETAKKLQMLAPASTPDLATRTLYESGRLDGLAERSDRTVARAPIVAGVGFLSGIVAAVLLMNSFVFQHRPIPMEPIASATRAKPDPLDQQAESYRVGAHWELGIVNTASLIQHAIVQQSANGLHFETYEEHMLADSELSAIKPPLTYGQLVLALNNGDLSLLDQ